MELDDAIQMFKMLANPIRLKLLKILSEKDCDYRVSDLEHILEIPQPSVSQHLGHLRNTGMIKFEKKGKTICYRIANPTLAMILDNVTFADKDRESMKRISEEINKYRIVDDNWNT